MKCPKCGGRLVYWGATGALLKCEQCKFGWGNEELWQELIRTRKALDKAKDGLEYLFTYDDDVLPVFVLKHIMGVLNQIKTALEQKDNGGNK